MFCNKCGNQVSEGATFCPKCGNTMQKNQKKGKLVTKKRITIFAVVLAIVFFVVILPQITYQPKSGYEYDINGFHVVMVGNSLVIANYYGTEEDTITIPQYFRIHWKKYPVTGIGEGVFRDCKNLKSVVISDGVKEIGDYAFCDCTRLSRVEIPESITKIGDYAFCGCNSLRRAEIPDGVMKIGAQTFYGCNSLEKVEIPDSVVEIGNHAFAYCISLENIEIPDSVTKIGNAAFFCCDELECIEIPDSVVEIGDGVLEYCSNLNSVIYADEEVPIELLDSIIVTSGNISSTSGAGSTSNESSSESSSESSLPYGPEDFVNYNAYLDYYYFGDTSGLK